MAAYLIILVKINDRDGFAPYAKAVPALIKKHGGRYAVAGGPVEVLEGSYDGRRVVVLEFPSMEMLKGFWDSEDYAQLKRLRGGSAEFDAWAVPGN